ncbi:MAG TPA: type II toxin-antitoxin system VapC family toxin [Steroidobacteraceae bacterium]
MSVVLDSSVTLAWLFSDELTEPVRQVFERVTASRAWVPSLWRLEVANSLHMAARRKRIDAGLRDASLADLALLNIGTDPDTDAFAWSTTLQLAEAHALTVYDAAYLELAQRMALPLATLDEELRNAARALGVALLGR